MSNISGQHFNRISVCPLSNKGRRMKSHEKHKEEECITDLKRGEQVYAVKGYSEQRNKTSLKFCEGEIITLLDQYSDGMCKGFISKLGSDSKVGIFPATCVVPFTKNNINSSISANNRKFSRKINDYKEMQRTFNSSVAVREKEKSTPSESPLKPISGIGPMYSCNYIEIRKSRLPDTIVNLPIDSLNRGSTCSVDSGRGSTTVTIMNSIKMNIPVTPVTTFDQRQFIPECDINQSIESGLASYQRHSSSSSSSIDGGGSIDGSKLNSSSLENSQRQILKTTVEEDRTDGHVIANWLQKMNLEMYTSNFINAGYDFNTLLRMTPEDLNAIGITNPKHRKMIKNDIINIITNIGDNQSDSLPASVEEWLIYLNLTTYLKIVLQQGYDKVEKLTDLTWEDLEEIGIKKLGHQKKIILAVERLKKMIKNSSNEKLPMSYSVENFKNSKSIFISSETSQDYRSKNENPNVNPAYLDLSKYSSSKPKPPVRQVPSLFEACLSLNKSSLNSPIHNARPNAIDQNIPPPTPKRISSIMSSPKQIIHAIQRSNTRKAYENLNEFVDIFPKSPGLEKNIHENRSQVASEGLECPKTVKPDIRLRSSSIMQLETNGLPFANEDCGTIKQRSSSLDRTEVLREEIEFGVLNFKSKIPPMTKPILPLTLPYIIDSLSFKSQNSSEKYKAKVNCEKKIQVIPSDVNVAVREKVPLPKLLMDDNSSNEDFNEICDMLEDLTELLDKEVSRNN